MVFHALAQSRLFPRFSSTRKNKSFLQYFATGAGTASCQDYEEYEFVECLSEETQIIVLFTNCKLRPHKLSQCTLATSLNSCQLWILFRPVARCFMGKCDPKRTRSKRGQRGKSLGGWVGGSFGCLRLNCAASLQLGGGGLTLNALTCTT